MSPVKYLGGLYVLVCFCQKKKTKRKEKKKKGISEVTEALGQSHTSEKQLSSKVAAFF